MWFGALFTALFIQLVGQPAFATPGPVIPFECNLVFQGASTAKSVDWIEKQLPFAQKYLMAAVGPQEASPGAVMASPTRKNPNLPVSQDYFFHWKRDAARVMLAIYHLGVRARKLGDQTLASQLFQKVEEYAQFSRRLQQTPNRSGAADRNGVGEPKFHMNGDAFWDDWIRPQNDGPALEAITLMAYADDLIAQGRTDRVKDFLYDPTRAKKTVIQVNLDVTEAIWSQPSGNVWEDKIGDHFYTRMTQWRALQDGSRFAKRLGDLEAAQRYEDAARQVRATLDSFFDSGRGYILASKNVTHGVDPGESLDAEVLLGVLHVGPELGSFSVSDPRVMATMRKFEQRFEALYPINQIKQSPTGDALGPALGRYGSDTYDGYGNSEGHAWFITTLMGAEYYYRLVHALRNKKEIWIDRQSLDFWNGIELGRPVFQDERWVQGSAEFEQAMIALTNKADRFVQRVKRHAGPDGHLSEQFNRHTGLMQGVEDLTWSNEAVVATYLAIQNLVKP